MASALGTLALQMEQTQGQKNRDSQDMVDQKLLQPFCIRELCTHCMRTLPAWPGSVLSKLRAQEERRLSRDRCLILPRLQESFPLFPL